MRLKSWNQKYTARLKICC